MRTSLSLVFLIFSVLFLNVGCKVLVTPVDPDAPVAYSFSADTYEDQSFSDHLDGVATKGGYLVYEIVDYPQRGSLIAFDSDSGDFTYRPSANFHGADYFSYRVWEDGLYSEIAVVSIEVHASNDRPTAQNFSIMTHEDLPRSGYLVGYDPDGDRLRFSVTRQPLKGSLTVDSQTGLYNYRPDSNVYGSDSFRYTVNDGQSTSQEAIVSVDLDAVNDAPVARPVVFNVVAGSCYSGYFSATDVDGGQSSFFLDHRPVKGSISLDTVTGAFTYCADAGTSGTDTFSYKAYDGMDLSSPATVQAQITYSETARAVSTTSAPRRSH